MRILNGAFLGLLTVFLVAACSSPTASNLSASCSNKDGCYPSICVLLVNAIVKYSGSPDAIAVGFETWEEANDGKNPELHTITQPSNYQCYKPQPAGTQLSIVVGSPDTGIIYWTNIVSPITTNSSHQSHPYIQLQCVNNNMVSQLFVCTSIDQSNPDNCNQWQQTDYSWTMPPNVTCEAT